MRTSSTGYGMVASSGVSDCSAVVLIVCLVQKKTASSGLAVSGIGRMRPGSIPPPAGGKAVKIKPEGTGALHHLRFKQNPGSLASFLAKSADCGAHHRIICV